LLGLSIGRLPCKLRLGGSIKVYDITQMNRKRKALEIGKSGVAHQIKTPDHPGVLGCSSFDVMILSKR